MKNPMRRMDGLSAFLIEQENTGAYQHTLKISILDASGSPGVWSYEKFRDSVARRLHLDLYQMLLCCQ